jgi:hypothetical protein
MIRLLILLCWAFVSCAPSLNSTPPSEMTKNVSRETSFEELAKRSSERLQMPFLLGGEDVSALYLEWEDMFRTYEDELLALWFEKLPGRDLALRAGLEGEKEKSSKVRGTGYQTSVY